MVSYRVQGDQNSFMANKISHGLAFLLFGRLFLPKFHWFLVNKNDVVDYMTLLGIHDEEVERIAAILLAFVWW